MPVSRKTCMTSFQIHEHKVCSQSHICLRKISSRYCWFEVRGEGARIALKFHYKSAPEETGEETLLKTPAGWRIQVLGQGK